MKIKYSELKNLVEKILSSKYYSQEEAEKISEVFLFAEMTGKNTQGILKMLSGKESAQEIKPKYSPKVIKETRLSALIDGGGATGPLVAQIAVDKVIGIAEEHGFGIVGTTNTFSSIGALSFYTHKIATHDFIGFATAGSPKATLHHGGIDPLYGTNPLSYSFPTNNSPIVFDMATSAITWYGLVRAKMLGKKLPEGVAIDKNGNPTTDPTEAMEGALLPFDKGFKGSGLAMSMELLTGPLTGAHYVFLDGDWGNIFTAMSPDLLIGLEKFKEKSSDLAVKVKQSRTREGKKIHIPGEDIEEKMQKVIESNEIEIEEKIWKQLQDLT